MGRQKSGKPYRFVEASGRPIQCIFAHIPGKRFSTGTYDRDEAVEWALDFLRNDGIRMDGVPTLAVFAKDFFLRTDQDSIQKRYEAFDKSMNPIWAIQRHQKMENYILPKFGGYRLDAITPNAIENWITTISGIRYRKLSNAYKNSILGAFKLVMEDAVRKEYIQVNPVEQAMWPAKKPLETRRAFSIHEQELLFPQSSVGRVSVWETLQWATFFSIMYDTGFRPGEIGGLQLGDIYTTPNGMAIFTNHSINCKTRKPVERVKTSGKGAENRVGLVSDITADLIKAHIQGRHISDPEEYLFRTNKNDFISATCSGLHFTKVMEQMGIEGMCEYCVRHTFLTYKRGEVDDNTLALAMGHSNGPRNDYDHRDAEILIGQLEKKRDALFKKPKESDIVPFVKKKA